MPCFLDIPNHIQKNIVLLTFWSAHESDVPISNVSDTCKLWQLWLLPTLDFYYTRWARESDVIQELHGIWDSSYEKSGDEWSYSPDDYYDYYDDCAGNDSPGNYASPRSRFLLYSMGARERCYSGASYHSGSYPPDDDSDDYDDCDGYDSPGDYGDCIKIDGVRYHNCTFDSSGRLKRLNPN